MSFRILTHMGKAHMDELIASALVCIYKGAMPDTILRLSQKEVETIINEGSLNEGDWVLDCGLLLDPEKHIFDHHQDRDLPSAASLVFQSLFPDWKKGSLVDTIELISRVDTRGIHSLGDFDDLDESLKYFNFSQKLLLKGFELDPDETLRMVTDVLKDMMDFEKSCDKAWEWLNQTGHVEINEIGSVKVLNYLISPPQELVQPLRAVDKGLVDEEEIDAVYSYDDKNPEERGLFRTIHGKDKLDFSRSTPDHLHFCHAAGFLMKFTPSDEQEWVELVKQSTL